MSKCSKVKNPCKICLSPVTRKTGLQCEGACQSWVHYSCLNYTPGKIKDIKAGIIKITCPCPDCKTGMPKEYRTDQPYSCNNSMCPANQPPKCDNSQCPTNSGGRQMPQGPPCPLSKCGTQCKEFSNPNLPNNRANVNCPPPKPCKAEFADIATDSCFQPNKCSSGCSSTNDVSGDFKGKPPDFAVVEQMCNTVGELTNQIKELMCQMKQANRGGGGGGPPPPANKAPGGEKDVCPKPCFCPGNPARRM